MSTSHVTTHVLDTGSGRPAKDVPASLHRLEDAGWTRIAEGMTDSDGRVKELGPARLPSGTYRLTFGTGTYFAASGTEAFYPEVTLTFSVGSEEHYHVPLLLSPFAYSTYRGS
jgi:5-hydroxyisourate hydrolase